jgi:ATP/maltotriose-dependent transcriptional regulator MalT
MESASLQAGREALARGAWEEARAAFERSLAEAETPEALEGLGAAAWWLDDAKATFESRERAYRLYCDRGDRQSAARLAIAIAEDCLDFRGETAVATGWRERARHHLDGLDHAPERGWLALWEAQFALLGENDPAGARRRAVEAGEIGRGLGLVDLEMAARALEGLALVTEGRVAEGMPRLDEATAAALAGEMRDFVAVGVSCCYLISACERIRDFDRAAQWCERVKEFCRRWRLQSLFAVCRAHYAAVLVWRGEWAEAEAELVSARRELAAVRPALQGEGTVRLAELRRLQGRLEEAEALLRDVEEHPLALLVGAALAQDKGDAARSADLAERFLRGIAPEDRTDRLVGLEVLTRALVALGRRRGAAASLETLRSVAEAIGTEPVRATARLAEGCLAGAQGDSEGARRLLEDAVDLFRRSGSPFETARARLELARALFALGRSETAEEETRLAREAFERLGARHEARRAEALLEPSRSLEAKAPGGRAAPLTARELDVLRLVAQGLSNATIGDQLGVSEFTIKRHVANILTKLELPSRAAAAAYGARHGLI